MWYSPPGLFLWPQICDSLPFHKRIQRPGDLWCPLQCRIFHEQHDGAEGPTRDKRKSIFQGTFPLSCWSIRDVFQLRVNRPGGLWKSCLVQMEGKNAVPALGKLRLPSAVPLPGKLQHGKLGCRSDDGFWAPQEWWMLAMFPGCQFKRFSLKVPPAVTD